MRKTSVYLTDAEADELKRAAVATGRSQADLIRAGISQIVAQSGIKKRRFHSMGIAHGGGEPYGTWNPDDLYRSVMGHEE